MNGNVLLRFKHGDKLFVLTEYFLQESERNYSKLTCDGFNVAVFDTYVTEHFIEIIKSSDIFGKELLDNLKSELSKYA